MRAAVLCLLIAVGASGISVVEDAVNSKEMRPQVSFNEVCPRQTSKHPLRAPAALLQPRSQYCILTSLSTVTHPAPYSLPWALQDEFEALLNRRSLAEHASRRRLNAGFGYCSGQCGFLPGCDKACSDFGTDKDACQVGQFLTLCKWNDMTIPAIVIGIVLLCVVCGCCACCCRGRNRNANANANANAMNIHLMQPAMQPAMQPGMMQPGFQMQPGYQIQHGMTQQMSR